MEGRKVCVGATHSEQLTLHLHSALAPHRVLQVQAPAGHPSGLQPPPRPAPFSPPRVPCEHCRCSGNVPEQTAVGKLTRTRAVCKDNQVISKPKRAEGKPAQHREPVPPGETPAARRFILHLHRRKELCTLDRGTGTSGDTGGDRQAPGRALGRRPPASPPSPPSY